MLEQKGIYAVVKNILSLMEGLKLTPPSSARIKRDTYVPGMYTYQHFLFDFPFDEIYRRLLFFTLGRMYHTFFMIMYQLRMIPGTYCIAICLFVSGWWYA